MDFIKTEIDGCFEVVPKVFGDNRGWFYESYSKKVFEENGINIDFVQDNRSFSAKKGTLRGLHCQKDPFAQAKIVTCLRGEIIDVAVDIREGSPTYMKKVMVKLTGENKKMLLIPRGCLHGFVSLTEDVEISYKVDNLYEPSADRSIKFDDPEINVEWGEINPVLSEKDKNAPPLKDSDVKFTY